MIGSEAVENSRGERRPNHPGVAETPDDSTLCEATFGPANGVRFSVRGRSRGQPDFDGIEVFEDGAPRREFARRVPPVAFVGDDAIESVNRDVELVRFIVPFIVAFLERGRPTEKVDRHALDGAT